MSLHINKPQSALLLGAGYVARALAPRLVLAFGHLTSAARWIAYLSATSVYGDRSGQWAYEGEAPTPGLKRGQARADAELAWIETIWPVHIFRLAGIYGPGRAPFDKLRQKKARTILKDGHVVNRIHVDDIVDALFLSLKSPNPQSIYKHRSYRDGLESILRKIS